MRLAAFAGQPRVRAPLHAHPPRPGRQHPDPPPRRRRDPGRSRAARRRRRQQRAGRRATGRAPHSSRLHGRARRRASTASRTRGHGRRLGLGRETTAATVVLVSPRFWQEYPKDLVLVDRRPPRRSPRRRRRPGAPRRGAPPRPTRCGSPFSPSGRRAPPRQTSRTALAHAARRRTSIRPGWCAPAPSPSALAPGDPGGRSVPARLATPCDRYRARAHAPSAGTTARPAPCDARTAERPRVGLLRRAQLGRLELPRLPRPRPRAATRGATSSTTCRRSSDSAGSRPATRAFVGRLRRRGAPLSRRRHHPPRPGASASGSASTIRTRCGTSRPRRAQNVDLGHTWLEGLLTHYRLTGEVRSRDAARAHGRRARRARRARPATRASSAGR